MSYLEPLWHRLAGQDPDYQVALWGLRDGRLFEDAVSPDVRRFPRDLNNLLRPRGWREKEALGPTPFAHGDVDKLIVEYHRMKM